MTIFHSEQAKGLLGVNQNLAGVHEVEGKFRVARFHYTADGTETFGDTIVLAPLPPGQIMVLGEMSFTSSDVPFTGYDLGHEEFKRANGTLEPRSLARFGSKAGTSAIQSFDGDDSVDNTVFDALRTFWILASITGASPSAGGVIHGHVCYTIS